MSNQDWSQGCQGGGREDVHKVGGNYDHSTQVGHHRHYKHHQEAPIADPCHGGEPIHIIPTILHIPGEVEEGQEGEIITHLKIFSNS